MKLNLLLIVLFTSAIVKAQVTPGSLFIGGDLQLSGSTSKGESPVESTIKSNYYYLSPVVGWAVKENLVVGGRLTGSLVKSSNSQPYSTQDGYGLGAGVFVRKYLPLGKSFYLFGDASLNGQYNHKEQENSVGIYELEENGYSVAISIYPGIAYQVNKSLFVEASLNNFASLGYSHNKVEQNAGSQVIVSKNNSYQLSSSIGSTNPLQLGFRWIIPKK
ncbi:MAG: hypothetical protein V4725_05880 [Bacteroidota bacterium]